VKVRFLDRAVAGIGLVVLLPLLAVVAIAIKVTSPGPVLHRAPRVGVCGRPLTVYKFRSMRQDAAASGPGLTQRGDQRVTKVGRWLRSSKIDELPQLWNVVRGEMSIVGPRPEDPRYVATYSATQRAILGHPPGITSPASLQYRDEEVILAGLVAGGATLEAAYEELMADKIRIDTAYLARRTMRDDASVVVRTLFRR
jgi:lipopolysaccharide/colanic/teichoic acid biosynthesis glycosyltransferase